MSRRKNELDKIVTLEDYEIVKLDEGFYIGVDGTFLKEMKVGKFTEITIRSEKIYLDIEDLEQGFSILSKGDVDKYILRNGDNYRVFHARKGSVNGAGYYSVINNGVMYRRARTLLKAFRPTDGMEELQCDHIDRNKLNDNLNNLRWTTRSENNLNKEYANYKLITRDGEVEFTGTSREVSEYLQRGSKSNSFIFECIRKKSLYKGMYYIERV